jgi:transposase InsO family protein
MDNIKQALPVVQSDDEKNAVLKQIYYDPKTGLGSALELYNKVRAKNPMTLKYIKAWLEKQEVQQIHRKPIVRKTQMFSIEANRGTWQVDFCFLSDKKINNGYHCLFCAVEIGSRFAFCYATKNIQEEATKDCFRKLLKVASKQKLGLKYVVSDLGSEFKSHSIARWFKKHKVGHRMVDKTYHYLANSLVERFNGTIKTKIRRYLTAYRTKKWIDHLDDLVSNYNNSNHTHLNTTPLAVASDPVLQLYNRLKTLGKNNNLKADPKYIGNKLNAGSTVRIRKPTDEVFAKASNTYSKKTHKVIGIVKQGTMVRVKGIDRLLRPWELGHIKTIEKNPYKRKTRSSDVENALEKGRKRRSDRINDDDDTNGGQNMDDEVPEPREKRRPKPRKPIEVVLDDLKKKRKTPADPVPYVQQFTPVSFVNNSKYRIKWSEAGHRDFGKAFSVSIKDVDINNGTCSIQYYRTGNWNVNQNLTNFDVIDKRNNKIPMIIKENVPEIIPEKRIPVAKSAVVENNTKYKIKWIEGGHRDYGKSFSVTIKDVDNKNETCSIQYYRIRQWQENQSLLNFEIVNKLGTSPVNIPPPPPPPKLIKKVQIPEKSIPPPRAVVENDIKYRIRWVEEGHRDFDKTYSVTVKDVTSETCSLQYFKGAKWVVKQSLSNFKILQRLTIKPKAKKTTSTCSLHDL